MFPIFISMTAGVIASLSKANETRILATTMAAGIAISLYEIIREFSDMLPGADINCGDPNASCRGDLSDILAFSVPIIATGIYLIRNRRHLNEPLDSDSRSL